MGNQASRQGFSASQTGSEPSTNLKVFKNEANSAFESMNYLLLYWSTRLLEMDEFTLLEKKDIAEEIESSRDFLEKRKNYLMTQGALHQKNVFSRKKVERKISKLQLIWQQVQNSLDACQKAVREATERWSALVDGLRELENWLHKWESDVGSATIEGCLQRNYDCFSPEKTVVEFHILIRDIDKRQLELNDWMKESSAFNKDIDSIIWEAGIPRSSLSNRLTKFKQQAQAELSSVTEVKRQQEQLTARNTLRGRWNSLVKLQQDNADNFAYDELLGQNSSRNRLLGRRNIYGSVFNLNPAADESWLHDDMVAQRSDTTVSRSLLRSDSEETAAEYYKVHDRVMKFALPTHGIQICIESIEKIKNPILDEKMELVYSQLFRADNPPELLFHGTKKEIAEKIILEGFKLGGSGMYGAGIYFATDSTKSARYCKGPGKKYLLLCEVALGRTMVCETSQRDLNFAKVQSAGYDSVFAKRGTKQTGGVINDEYIVYRPEQVAPRYLVTFTDSAARIDSFDSPAPQLPRQMLALQALSANVPTSATSSKAPTFQHERQDLLRQCQHQRPDPMRQCQHQRPDPMRQCQDQLLALNRELQRMGKCQHLVKSAKKKCSCCGCVANQIWQKFCVICHEYDQFVYTCLECNDVTGRSCQHSTTALLKRCSNCSQLCCLDEKFCSNCATETTFKLFCSACESSLD